MLSSQQAEAGSPTVSTSGRANFPVDFILKKECFEQARGILLCHCGAVDALVVDLIELGWTPGGEAYLIIRLVLVRLLLIDVWLHPILRSESKLPIDVSEFSLF